MKRRQRCRRQQAGAGPDRAQAGQIGIRPLRVFRQGLERGGHLQGERGAFVCDAVQRGRGVEARKEQDARTDRQRRQGLEAQAADVEQRQHGEHGVAGRQALDLGGDGHVGQQVALGMHRGLGGTRGARGVDQQHRCVPRFGDLQAVWVRGGGVQPARQLRHRDEGAGGRRGLRQRLGGRCEVGVVHQHPRLAVGQHGGPLGGGKPVVQRHQLRTEPRQRKQQHDLQRVVQPQPGDPVTGLHPVLRLQMAGDGRGPARQLRKVRVRARRRCGVACTQRESAWPFARQALQQAVQRTGGRENRGRDLGHLPNFTRAAQRVHTRARPYAWPSSPIRRRVVPARTRDAWRALSRPLH
ncbi:hypothetical protein D9M69_452630 [compost metagenome]